MFRAIPLGAAPLLLIPPACADVRDYLLPNGEPIVGVYYYSWFAGPPYCQVAWTPEFEYDNRGSDDGVYEITKAMTDHGINQASYRGHGRCPGSFGRDSLHSRRLPALARDAIAVRNLEDRKSVV